MLEEGVISMLHKSGMPLSFWEEALASFVHTHNRVITSALLDSTPQESSACLGVGCVLSHRLLAAQYGGKKRKKTGKKSSGNKQMVKQEYQAYMIAVLSPEEIDLLKFWEVGGNTVLEHY